ncbi:MAG: hypothetical protein PHE29_02070 [Tissierellia bacterium]|nr:hypothetical protein [Tissierellia bacterium]
MLLSKVYHWSPTTNRKSILQNGLKILNSHIEYENPLTGKNEVWECPYICTSLEARTAYTYVEPMFMDDGEMPSMDLYEIDLINSDEVEFRNDYTIQIIEVRIYNSISPERIHYIATRENEH